MSLEGPQAQPLPRPLPGSPQNRFCPHPGSAPTAAARHLPAHSTRPLATLSLHIWAHKDP